MNFQQLRNSSFKTITSELQFQYYFSLKFIIISYTSFFLKKKIEIQIYIKPNPLKSKTISAKANGSRYCN